MIPTTIAPPSALDPLILLPLPDLPPTDTTLSHLHAAVDAISASLAASAPGGSSASSLPSPVLAAGMRTANRTAQAHVNAARTGAAQARAHLDSVDVGLRTVEYELARVRDEMARCMEYEPMYESMDMPDEGAFVAENPEIVEGLPTDPEAHKYALIIARLEAELAAIVEHEKQVAALTAERDGIVRSRREVKAKFDAVDVWLSDFAKTSNAMQSKIRDVTKGAKPKAASPPTVEVSAPSPADSPAAAPAEDAPAPGSASEAAPPSAPSPARALSPAPSPAPAHDSDDAVPAGAPAA